MIIQSKRIWLAGQFVPAQLDVGDGMIRRVLPYGQEDPGLDYGDLRVLPGLIDTHTHGAYGFDTNTGDLAGLLEWLRRVPEEGVTALLPATVTQSEEVLAAALRNTASVAEGAYEGAELLGVHLEGPFLSAVRKGAQPPEHIVPPNREMFDRLQEAAGGRIRLVTLAPEEDPNFELTRYLSSQGVAVSMGHTDATYEQALFAVANGVTGATHTFNGMTPFGHREPGVSGAVLRCGDLYGEIIPDGVHCHFAAVGAFFAAKGADRAVAVTDSLLIKGALAGDCRFGGHSVMLREDGRAAVLTEAPSTLAGSVLGMNEALRNLVEKALVPFGAALNACTANPARRLGLGWRKGTLAAGYDADIAVLADDYSVVQAFCRGRPSLPAVTENS